MTGSIVPRRQLSRRKRLLFSGVVFFSLFVISFVAAEAYFRLRYRNLDLWEKTGRKVGRNPMAEWALADAFSAYRGRPGVYRVKKSKGEKTVNSHGFISTPEISPQKPENTVRIVFLGGSSTAGTGHLLSDRDTWPWRASEIVAAGFGAGRVEFINAALGGYSSFESFGRLWSRIRFFSPDILVLYHGWNEMHYFRRVDTLHRWRTLPDGSWSVERAGQSLRTHRALWIDYLARPSQLLTRVRLRFAVLQEGEVAPALPEAEGESEPRRPAPRGPTHTPEPGEYDPRALEVWRSNLRLMRETASVLGAELFVAKQATLVVPDLVEELRERCRYDYHRFGHEAHVRAFDDLYRVIDEEIRADRIIDTTTLSGRPDLFHDHVHATREGARAIAQIVADALLSYLESGDEPQTG